MYLTLSIDKVVELHFISHSASGPIIRNILQSCLRKHSCEITESVVSEMVTELCDANPFTIALSSGGPLSSADKRRAYFKEHFAVVGPVEYVLRREEDRSFQCPYSKKSLHQVLSQKEILTLILHDRGGQRKGETQYRAFSDDIYYKTKEFFSEEDPVIAIIIYVDDSGHIKEGEKKSQLCTGCWLMFLHFSDLCEPPTS